MRPATDPERIRRIARELGRLCRQPAAVYLVGGSTAVMEGWRASTIDIDIRVEPDDELLRHLAQLKERLATNIELASPADFLPELPGWRERSPFLFREGPIDFFHYDFYSQALAKLERGFDLDRADVNSMLASGAVHPTVLADLLTQIEPAMYRFPAVDLLALRRSVSDLLPRS